MLKYLTDKFLFILRRIAYKDQSDRFKKLILFLVGVIKYIQNQKIEAKAYWKIICFGQATSDKMVAASFENEKYYKILEDQDYRTYVDSAKQLILSVFPEKGDEICDIGCGRGFLVKKLEKEGYKKAIGIEVSKWAIEHKVTERVYLKTPGDFKENQFKVVSLISVLEHVKKDKLPLFLKSIARITSDYIICCIPTYPHNLFNFFVHDSHHQIFERRKWWDAEFKKAGFYPWALPQKTLPFIEPFVYKKAKIPEKKQVKTKKIKDSSEIYFNVDISSSNAFTWSASRLCLALNSLGYDVSIKPSSLSNKIEIEDREYLERRMRKSRGREVQIKWSHYARSYLKQKLNGSINFEFFAINYFFKDNNKREFDYWIRDILKNGYFKLATSTFCKDVLIKAGVSAEKCFVLPLGFSPEVVKVKERIHLPTTKKFKFLSITNSKDPYRHGTDILLKAFTQAFSEKDDVVLIIKDYGGKDVNIETISNQKGIPEVLYITQFFPKNILINLYNTCDFFVAPFRGEGFGMKILDAMASGLPTILPLFSGPTEYANAQNCFPVEYKIVPMRDCFDTKKLQIGNNPYWCEVKVDSLTKVMRYVYESPKVAEKRGIEGREFVLSNFSWEQIAGRLINIIDSFKDKED